MRTQWYKLNKFNAQYTHTDTQNNALEFTSSFYFCAEKTLCKTFRREKKLYAYGRDGGSGDAGDDVDHDDDATADVTILLLFY